MDLLKESMFCLLLVSAVIRPTSIIITASKVEPAPEDYILKIFVEPTTYDLELTVPVNFETSGTFSGIVKIGIQLKKAPIAKDTTGNIISLHIDKNYIKVSKSNNKLYETAGRYNNEENLLDSEYFIQNEQLQMLSLKLKEHITLNPDRNYTLEIQYTAMMPNNSTRGFYRSSYITENGDTEVVASTQFQATHARKAFPCFDEPQYKAKFRIKIMHPTDYHALSNAEVEKTEYVEDTMKKTTFAWTPKMSTYLVAFIVSKYVEINYTIGMINNSAWSSRKIIHSVKYALSVVPKILNAMKNFTGISYTYSGLKKLDQVSIPDFAAGAMENWGLVTYMERALHWNSNESNLGNKQLVATTVGHELAHMWFGNLVTLKWWNCTWLNEGFANYFQFHATAKAEPTLELDRQFLVKQLQTVLNSDSISTSPALTSPAFSPEQINSRFSTITYAKGGSIVRMIEHFLGTNYFFDKIKNYINHNKFKNVEPDDLWNALYDNVITQKPDLPSSLKTVMESWTEKGGFPVVTVSKNKNNELIFKQKHFFIDACANSSDTIWYIPISYTTSDKKEFDGNTQPKLWLKDEELTDSSIWEDGMTWIILNIKQTAFIHVNYDNTLWNGIQDALRKDDFDKIDPLNRAQIVCDIMNLARANEVKYEKALDLVSYLENELDYYPWYSAFNAFAFLQLRFDRASKVAKLLNIYISRLMQKYYDHAIIEHKDETPIQVYSKVQALAWACRLDHIDCVKYSLERFNWLKDGVPVDPNLQSVVYCTALRHSSNRSDWEVLWNKFISTKVASEASTLLTALGCTKDIDLMYGYLMKSITEDSGIRSQDAATVFTSIVTGSHEGVTVGLLFLKEHHSKIAKRYNGVNALSKVISVLADSLTQNSQVKELEQFVEENQDVIKEALETANSAIKSANANMKWANDFGEEVQKYLQHKVGGNNYGTGSDSDYLLSEVE